MNIQTILAEFFDFFERFLKVFTPFLPTYVKILTMFWPFLSWF